LRNLKPILVMRLRHMLL